MDAVPETDDDILCNLKNMIESLHTSNNQFNLTQYSILRLCDFAEYSWTRNVKRLSKIRLSN